MSLIKVKKKYKHACMMCGDPTPPKSGRKYIFPIPAKYNPKPHDGAYACNKCAPKVLAEQKADGHMEMVQKEIS